MQSDKFGQHIVQQDIALDSYLATLLHEIPDNLEPEPPVAKKEPEPKIKSKIQSVSLTTANRVQPATKTTAPPKTQIIHPLSVMPEWSQHEFQALYFRVDQLILAVPLTALLRTIKLEHSPTKIPGQPSWFMGLLDTHSHRVGVLDTGQLVFGKQKGQQRTSPFKSLLITHDGRWGLACDEVLSISRLIPEKVRWRTIRQKRPWLIGTVIDELTAIIDVDYLVPHRKSDKK